MSDSIELRDLRNAPFKDLEEVKPSRPLQGYILVFIELCAAVEIYYTYFSLSTTYPLLAPTLLGAVLAALAQSISQILTRKHAPNKICKFLLWGTINGGLTAMWIGMLVANVEHVAFQIIIDQTVGNPMFQFIFALLNSLWERDPLFSGSSRSTFFKSLRYSLCYWPFVSAITFLVVPPRYMFLMNCIATFVWNIVLCKLG